MSAALSGILLSSSKLFLLSFTDLQEGIHGSWDSPDPSFPCPFEARINTCGVGTTVLVWDCAKETRTTHTSGKILLQDPDTSSKFMDPPWPSIFQKPHYIKVVEAQTTPVFISSWLRLLNDLKYDIANTEREASIAHYLFEKPNLDSFSWSFMKFCA